MESLIGLVNRIQRACTVLGDHGGGEGGALPTLWDALPSVAVVGGQVYLFLLPNLDSLRLLHRIQLMLITIFILVIIFFVCDQVYLILLPNLPSLKHLHRISASDFTYSHFLLLLTSSSLLLLFRLNLHI